MTKNLLPVVAVRSRRHLRRPRSRVRLSGVVHHVDVEELTVLWSLGEPNEFSVNGLAVAHRAHSAELDVFVAFSDDSQISVRFVFSVNEHDVARGRWRGRRGIASVGLGLALGHVPIVTEFSEKSASESTAAPPSPWNKLGRSARERVPTP